jgi:Tfp pilus assembly protein PilF
MVREGEKVNKARVRIRHRCTDKKREKRMRRSLTITPENDKKIQNTRSLFLDGENPIDFDYTTTVNMFIELGHKLFLAWAIAKKLGQQQAIIDINDVLNTIFSYAKDTELRDQAAMDLATDVLYKRLEEQYKRLMQKLQETQESVAPIVSK